MTFIRDIHNEKQLLTDFKQGNRYAFEKLYKLYSARIYNFAYSLLYNKNDAEDITQNCFIKLWEKREEIEVSKNFQAYLYTIARNMVYNESEKRIQEDLYATYLKSKALIEHPVAEEKTDWILINEQLSRLIDQLPRACQNVFVLSRKYGLSNKEISFRLTLSENTVKTQLYRALLFLKRKLKGVSFL